MSLLLCGTAATWQAEPQNRHCQAHKQPLNAGATTNSNCHAVCIHHKPQPTPRSTQHAACIGSSASAVNTRLRSKGMPNGAGCLISGWPQSNPGDTGVTMQQCLRCTSADIPHPPGIRMQLLCHSRTHNKQCFKATAATMLLRTCPTTHICNS